MWDVAEKRKKEKEKKGKKNNNKGKEKYILPRKLAKKMQKMPKVNTEHYTTENDYL